MGWVSPHAERILVIDDHFDSRFAICCGLQMHGHVCSHVGTAIAALESIDTFRPRVVMIEWRLRDGTGLGLARLLRRRASWPLVVIAVSTQAEPPGFRDEEQLDDYVTKPFGLAEFESWLGRGAVVEPLPRDS